MLFQFSVGGKVYVVVAFAFAFGVEAADGVVGAVGAGDLVPIAHRADGNISFFHAVIDFQQFPFHDGEKVFEIVGGKGGGGLGEGALCRKFHGKEGVLFSGGAVQAAHRVGVGENPAGGIVPVLHRWRSSRRYGGEALDVAGEVDVHEGGGKEAFIPFFFHVQKIGEELEFQPRHRFLQCGGGVSCFVVENGYGPAVAVDTVDFAV